MKKSLFVLLDWAFSYSKLWEKLVIIILLHTALQHVIHDYILYIKLCCVYIRYMFSFPNN